MTNFSFTSSQLLVGIFLGMLFLAGIIVAFRIYFNNNGKLDLKAKYAKKKRSRALRARNKYPEVDVFQHSPTFFRLGLIAALALTIAAFSWTQIEPVIEEQEIVFSIEEDVEVDIPRSTEPPPPPPPPPPPVIQEVPEELVLEEDEIEFVDQSVDAETAIDIPEAPMASRETAPPPPPPPPPSLEDDIKEIFLIVEEMPRFPGCEEVEGDTKAKKACADAVLLKYLAENIKYPPLALENNIQGSVIVQFVVDKDGKVQKSKVLRDIGANCGKEALRLVNSMNENYTWIPGKQRGRPVAVQFTLPIRFKLHVN